MNMDKFQSFGKNISASFTPFAQRTQQYVKEQFGQAEDKTELPPDYIELEKRVDALRAVHTKLLSVTSQYTNEAYDYPPNIRESFTDLSRTVSEKVKLLSTASSAAEAQAAFTAPPQATPQPKTFAHAIARASLAGAQQLASSDVRGSGADDHLAQALEKYAVGSERVGEARLTQDAAIQSRFLSPWTTTLNTNLSFAARARKSVENSRLGLDAVKAKARARFGPNEAGYDEPTRQGIEKAEDEFVNTVEEASNVMRNTLSTPEPLRNLLELVKAQEEFYANAAAVLKEVAGEVEGLQGEQEASYRQSRQGA